MYKILFRVAGYECISDRNLIIGLSVIITYVESDDPALILVLARKHNLNTNAKSQIRIYFSDNFY